MHAGIVVWNLFKRGGVEQVGVMLANAMHERGHKVTIFYAQKSSLIIDSLDTGASSNTPVYQIHPDINLVGVDLESLHNDIARAKKNIAHSGIDVLAALFSWDALLWFPTLLRNTGIPLLISEHNHPEVINNERWNASEHHACLAAADNIHILLHSFLKYYPRFLHDKIFIIPNPVETIQPPPSWTRTTIGIKNILGAGRFLDSTKQFSLLLQAFSLLAPQYPDWNLILCGGGKHAEKYKNMVATLGLSRRVKMPGMVSNMPAYYLDSHIFCIPSRVEGFGLVTTEAQSFGLPVVGFAACTGTNEIIVHNENGLLAENMTAECLAHNLSILMRDCGMRERMGKRGQELVVSRFDKHFVFDKWEELLLRTCRSKGNTRLQKLELPGPEQQRSEMALHEILCRPSPFARCDFHRIVELKKQLQTLKKWHKKVSNSWYYRVGLWCRRQCDVVKKIFY